MLSELYGEQRERANEIREPVLIVRQKGMAPKQYGEQRERANEIREPVLIAQRPYQKYKPYTIK